MVIYEPLPCGKVCSRCSQWHPLAEFNKDKSRKDGHHPWCRNCQKSSGKRYYTNNREMVHKKNGQYRKAHHEELRQYGKQYDDSHRQEKRERSKKSYRQRRDEILSRQKEKRRSDPEEYRKRVRHSKNAHPEQRTAEMHRHKARKRQLPANFTGQDWKNCLEHFKHRCAVCGRPRGLWHTIAADHWIPLSDPRPDNPGTVPWNIVPLCHGVEGCNNDKHKKDPLEWVMGKLGKKDGESVLDRINAYFEWVRQ